MRFFFQHSRKQHVAQRSLFLVLFSDILLSSTPPLPSDVEAKGGMDHFVSLMIFGRSTFGAFSQAGEDGLLRTAGWLDSLGDRKGVKRGQWASNLNCIIQTKLKCSELLSVLCRAPMQCLSVNSAKIKQLTGSVQLSQSHDNRTCHCRGIDTWKCPDLPVLMKM